MGKKNVRAQNVVCAYTHPRLNAVAHSGGVGGIANPAMAIRNHSLSNSRPTTHIKKNEFSSSP